MQNNNFETMIIPTRKQLSNIMSNEEQCHQFLVNNGIFYETLDCIECGSPLNRYTNRFMCKKRSCSKRNISISVRIGTFFFDVSLSELDIMWLSQHWLVEMPVKTAILMTGHSPETICRFYKYFRQLVTSDLREEDQIIGGEGVAVEIDETKLGKRKYNRGHRVDGVWIVVGIERTEQKKVFLIQVPNRSANILHEIIQRHVRPGSIIHTDLWRGYSNLNELGMDHLTVNHSQTFVDPISGACTNTVEGINSGLKRKIPVRNRVREGIELHLGEYIWRRQNEDRLFDAFVKAMRDIHYYI